MKFGLVDTSNPFVGHIWPCSVQGHFWVIQRSLKMAFDSKRLVVESKGGNLRLGDTRVIVIRYIDLIGFRVIGVIRCTCLRMTCISKTGGRKVDSIEIWGSRILVTYMQYLDLVGFVMWGSFGACVSKWPETWQRVVVEWNQVKSEARGH